MKDTLHLQLDRVEVQTARLRSDATNDDALALLKAHVGAVEAIITASRPVLPAERSSWSNRHHAVTP